MEWLLCVVLAVPNMLPTRRYRPLIDAVATLVQLPEWTVTEPIHAWPGLQERTYSGGEWLEALILAESNGDPKARRYEAHQDRVPDGDTPFHNDDLWEDDQSYGLMQVMGYNAKVMVGIKAQTRMDHSWLLLPVANIAIGTRILCQELAATGDNVPRALARYNGGPTGERIVNGKMRRQVYVDRIAAKLPLVREDRR